MTILDEILKNVEKSELDEQVKIVSDKIMEEELPKFSHPEDKPEGPNMFLAIEFDDRRNHSSFLCLERESKEIYILSIWTKRNIDDNIKRKQVWNINEIQPGKIFKFYAEKLKFLRGE